MYVQYQEEKNKTKKTNQTGASYEMCEPLTQKTIDDAIMRLITKKMLPINLVEDEYFREFVLSMFTDVYKLVYTHFNSFLFYYRVAWVQIRRKLSIKNYVEPRIETQIIPFIR